VASRAKRIRQLISLRCLGGLGGLCLSGMVNAIQATPPEGAEPQAAPVIEALGDEYQNSITLLQNRFRIDHNVSEITMVFFRQYGSAPVVLVRPDGSKIFQSRAEQENAVWFDADTYDMVTVKDPVPGPWQAVGQIKPHSRIMVISDITLEAQPLPATLFSGEIIKQTATLSNGDKPILEPGFRDVVTLTVELISTNNPNYANFKADNQLIATFEDNGRGMDEKPLDGVFTGQFNLTVPAGEWTPVFKVTTPMFSREQVDPPFMLLENPVSLDVTLAKADEQYHTLLINVDREQVNIDTLLVDGKVRYPNGDIQNFSLTEPTDAARVHPVLAMDEGLFKVKLTAYGQTHSGRDFILDVPEYSFEVNAPQPAPTPEQEPQDLAAAALPTDPTTALQEPPPEADEAMSTGTLITLLAVVNGTILLIVGGTVGYILWRRRQPVASASAQPDLVMQEAPDNSTAKSNPAAKLTKWFARFKKKPPPAD